MIQFDRFEKFYGDRLIVKADLSLPGNFYWLKGGNGSGKSTLLKSVTGLIPYRGDISVAGMSIKKQRMAYRNAVSYAEAEPLYPEFLTGSDLLNFYVETRGGSKLQADELVEGLNIGSFIHTKTGTYSSGMLKKLSLALAFIGNPKLIMLDEPFITIDTIGIEQLNVLIGNSLRNGVQVLITSHQELSFEGMPKPSMLRIENSELIQPAL
ncbi:ABC transporter ATP-binding protein [Polluticoccus soli]|uniref:ABC transporter ATP-binding protein n=1 Tax=Polluticoccus soli TaxID=3034150 RepID=UPI0023E14F18|nr:ABC transporter ATP-binding protein [Flavipsychrobacter sp. JY13-12]